MQKPTQYCKAIILQLKISRFLKKEISQKNSSFKKKKKLFCWWRFADLTTGSQSLETRDKKVHLHLTFKDFKDTLPLFSSPYLFSSSSDDGEQGEWSLRTQSITCLSIPSRFPWSVLFCRGRSQRQTWEMGDGGMAQEASKVPRNQGNQRTWPKSCLSPSPRLALSSPWWRWSTPQGAPSEGPHVQGTQTDMLF